MVRAAGNTVSCKTGKASPKAIARLGLYRRLLQDLLAGSVRNVYSHQLAEAAGGTATQVRRDLMVLECNGCFRRGYDVQDLARSIDKYLDRGKRQSVALVGVGNLGRALISYLAARCSRLELAVAFDNDPAKIGRIVDGCMVHSTDDLPRIVRELGIETAILAVPASEAQCVAEVCTSAGVRGLLNFTPFAVRVPEGTYVSHINLTVALETVAFFARGARGGSVEADVLAREAGGPISIRPEHPR